MKRYVFLLISLLAIAGTGFASQGSIDPREIFNIAGIDAKSSKTMSALYALRPELTSATYAAHRKTFTKGKHELGIVNATLV